MSSRKTRVVGGVAAWMLAAAVGACGGGRVPLPQLSTSTVGDPAGLVQRGEYLVRNVSVCGHCHSGDPRDSDGPLSGGRTFTNWRLGTIRAANLTPDAETGLGRWSENDFVQTIRTGRHLGRGRQVLPPMPIPVYSQMTDDDLKAVFAYLQTLPPVRNKVPEPLPPLQP